MTAEKPEKEVMFPRRRFEVRSLRDMALILRSGFIPLSGFGIFDLVAGGWVCLSKPMKLRIQRTEVYVPYSLKRKYVVEEAIESGLWSGYAVVQPEFVIPMRDTFKPGVLTSMPKAKIIHAEA